MLFQTRNLSYLIRLVVILLSPSIYYLCANIRANICWYQLSGWLEKSFSERGAITDIYQLSLSEWHNHYFLNDIIPALQVQACLCLLPPAPSTLLTHFSWWSLIPVCRWPGWGPLTARSSQWGRTPSAPTPGSPWCTSTGKPGIRPSPFWRILRRVVTREREFWFLRCTINLNGNGNICF